MQMSRFDMGKAPTLAFARFVKHHTELNDLYWSHIASYGYVRFQTKTEPASRKTELTLHLSGLDARRPPTFVGNWRKAMIDFNNWTRLGMLLSALSYMELYISEAVTLALQSDPMQTHNLSRSFDGLKLLKADRLPVIETKPFVKDTWSKRVAAYRRVFRSVPAKLDTEERALDQMRRLRNSVGHAFGRTMRGKALVPVPVESQRLSEDRLKSWLAVILDVCRSIDDHLKASHIGIFEYAMIFHEHQTLLRHGDYGRQQLAAAFSRFVSETFGRRLYRTESAQIIRLYLDA